MPLDPRAKRFLDMTSAGIKAERLAPTMAERRNALARLMQFARADAMAGPGIDGQLPGPDGNIFYRVYAPDEAEDTVLPGLVFFHGGGMVAGGIETHDTICRALVHESRCRLIAIDYRLAPEHPFPAAVDDAIAATNWISAHAAALGIDPAKLVIAGDSAGATLAAIVCQTAAHDGRPAIALQCLICPVLDFGTASISREEFAEGYLIDKATLAMDLAHYLPEGTDPANQRVSPLRADSLAGQPPAIIHTAEFDPLRDEGDAYALKLRESGVDVTHVCHDGMLHNFHAMGAVLPQGRAVLKQVGEQIRRALA